MKQVSKKRAKKNREWEKLSVTTLLRQYAQDGLNSRQSSPSWLRTEPKQSSDTDASETL